MNRKTLIPLALFLLLCMVSLSVKEARANDSNVDFNRLHAYYNFSAENPDNSIPTEDDATAPAPTLLFEFPDLTSDPDAVRPPQNTSTNPPSIIPIYTLIQTVQTPLPTGTLSSIGLPYSVTAKVIANISANDLVPDQPFYSLPLDKSAMGDDTVSTTSQIYYQLRAIVPPLPVGAAYPPVDADSANSGSALSNYYADYGYSNSADLPFTKCISISGNGPNAIVFTREEGESDITSIDELMANAQKTITDGFAKVDPYKTYLNQFSFYIDTANHNEDGELRSYFADESTYDPSAIDRYVMFQSSCNPYVVGGGVNGGYGEKAWYVLSMPPGDLISGQLFGQGRSFSTAAQGHVAFLVGDDIADPQVILHELGHMIGGLEDEYIEPDKEAPLLSQAVLSGLVGENCSFHPTYDYLDTTNNIYYGAQNDTGCGTEDAINGGLTENTNDPVARLIPLYRPSKDDLMRQDVQQNFDGGFNVISCGYMVAGILGEPLDHTHAQTYWQACENMMTVKDGIPPVNPNPPTIKSVNPEAPAANPQANPYTSNVFQAFSTWWDGLLQ